MLLRFLRFLHHHILIAIVPSLSSNRDDVSRVRFRFTRARRMNENDENDLAREIGSIVVEFRGGWDWRLWLTARGVCKKRTCLETSCFRVGGQLVFRDELFDFRREEGGFPACSSLPR